MELFLTLPQKPHLGSSSSSAPSQSLISGALPLSLTLQPHLGSFIFLAPSQSLISGVRPPQLHPTASSRELHLPSSIPRPHLGSSTSSTPSKASSRETPPPQLHPKASSRETPPSQLHPKASSREFDLLSSIPRPHLGRLHPIAPSQDLTSGVRPSHLHPKNNILEM